VVIAPSPTLPGSPSDTATETTVPDWRARLVCSHCGSHEIDMVVTGTERR
jgi:hypothetical protein